MRYEFKQPLEHENALRGCYFKVVNGNGEFQRMMLTPIGELLLYLSHPWKYKSLAEFAGPGLRRRFVDIGFADEKLNLTTIGRAVADDLEVLWTLFTAEEP